MHETSGSLACDGFQETVRTELIGGKVILMSPRPAVNHGQVAERINYLFRSYLKGKPCRPFGDGYDVYLTEKDHYVPDGMIVCDRSKIKWNGIYGAPDLVLEVLSPGTARNDRGRKKEIYERCGVREYWIASPLEKSIEQYLLEDGTLKLKQVSTWYPAWMLAEMEPEDRAEAESLMVFHCGLFDDLEIRLEDIFDDLF